MSHADCQARYRKSRREKGLCGYSGCPEVSGDAFHCEEHRKAHAARSLSSYHRKRKKAAREAA